MDINSDFLYTNALDKGGYAIDQDESLESQFKSMFIDFCDGGQFSNIVGIEEAEDVLEEYGSERVAKSLMKYL